MTTDPHIIEVTPELERRMEQRRKADLSRDEKARRFDALVLDARVQLDFWSKLYEQRPISYYEGRVHAYASILFYAEPASKKEQCERAGGGK